jgi:hypothetical protein
MGFLDKAKKLAEQAQTKLDDVQTQFNERQSGGQPGAGSGPAVEYDTHGRPVTPPATATPPHGDPLGEATPPDPAPASTGPTPDASAPAPAPPHGDPLAEAEPAPPPAPAPPPGADGPSGMTSGDPLAG